jgi:hypothetical protein
LVVICAAGPPIDLHMNLKLEFIYLKKKKKDSDILLFSVWKNALDSKYPEFDSIF